MVRIAGAHEEEDTGKKIEDSTARHGV